MRRVRLAIAILTFASALSAAERPSEAARADDAPSLYAMHCASCHGDHGQGSNVAPSVIGKTAVDIHFMLDTGRMPASVPYLDEIHREPRFTQVQIAGLVRYIQSFSPVPASASLPLVMPGDVVRGRALFAENCAQCHGAAGGGASIGASDVAPSLSEVTVFQVAEAIRAGPSVMPRFGPDVLSDRDVSDIAHFVNYSQTQAGEPDGEDAGGFSLAHLGPVAEGFAAWLFGLGALVLFARAVGTAGKDA